MSRRGDRRRACSRSLGGNALLRRGQELNAENQRGNIRVAAVELAAVHAHHELVIAHGNGPQVGLLALMDAAYTAVDPFPLDVLGAETVGMIGYMIEQELGNIIPADDHIVTVLTQVLVDPGRPRLPASQQTGGPGLRARGGGAIAAEKRAGRSPRTARTSAVSCLPRCRSASSRSTPSECWWTTASW
jgi:carbamate kinase